MGGGGWGGGEWGGWWGEHTAWAGELSVCDEVGLNKIADASPRWAVTRDKRSCVWVSEQGCHGGLYILN